MRQQPRRALDEAGAGSAAATAARVSCSGELLTTITSQRRKLLALEGPQAVADHLVGEVGRDHDARSGLSPSRWLSKSIRL
jgi:hypothetical protein